MPDQNEKPAPKPAPTTSFREEDVAWRELVRAEDIAGREVIRAEETAWRQQARQEDKVFRRATRDAEQSFRKREAELNTRRAALSAAVEAAKGHDVEQILELAERLEIWIKAAQHE